MVRLLGLDRIWGGAEFGVGRDDGTLYEAACPMTGKNEKAVRIDMDFLVGSNYFAQVHGLNL